MGSASSKSDAIDKLLAGVEADDRSVDSAWTVRGEEGAEEGSESDEDLEEGSYVVCNDLL